MLLLFGRFYVGIIVDSIFIVDIFVSLITGYWSPSEELIMKPKWTAKNYLKVGDQSGIVDVDEEP